MAAALLRSWPWGSLSAYNYKYVLYGPLVAMLLLLRYASPSWEEQSKQDQWCLIHLLTLCALRALTYQLWYSFSSMLFLVRRRRILKDGVDFKQIDQEWHWDDFLIFHCLLGVAAFYIFPSLRSLPSWDPKGLLISLPLHALVSEPLFYCIHRALHRPRLFKHYHSLHHSSRVPQPFTAGFATPMEHLLLCLVMGVPLAGAFLAGAGSVGLVYGYVLAFDFIRSMGYCNVEVFPQWVFETLPLLRYLIYTPTYHTIHHTGKNSNFCLFMPLFDLLGGTLDDNSWHLQKEISSGNIEQVPNFVFLGHVVDVIASTHAPFFSRSFSSVPFSPKPYILLWWPAAFVNLLQMWLWSKTFLFSLYTLRGRLHQFWVVPRCGFHYLLPFATKWINNEIEQAILSADRLGVEVLSLGGLNKNEALNGGGTLFVNKHRNLRVRIVHGNTLTAAALLNEIPKGVTEVFLTGATSKLGRAIALYLCQKGIRVLMLTSSTERFENIQKESPLECQQYLTHVTEYQAGQNCKTWIVGKWMSARQQQAAPPGTHFHQFAVPPISSSRRDCTYGKLAAMRLPSDVQGLGTCEHMLERGAVHACHAGGVVHLLEGWSHHEVGAIDVGQIEVVWQAALKHGLTPV